MFRFRPRLLTLSVFAVVLALGIAGSAFALDRDSDRDADAPSATPHDADAADHGDSADADRGGDPDADLSPDNLYAVFLPGRLLWVPKAYAPAFDRAHHPRHEKPASRKRDAESGTTTVEAPAAHDTSAPLVKLLRPAFPTGIPATQEHDNPRVATVGIPLLTTDTAVQSTPLVASVPAAATSFEGSHNTEGYVPPDTNGDVGGDFYVEWVNASFSVFNKNTGALDSRMATQCAPGGGSLTPACAGNSLWSGFTGGGSVCQNTNDGDPIVKFDKLAKRWIFTQFAFADSDVTATGTAGPYYQCMAVSSGSDPLASTYSRYAYAVTQVKLNDYPKLGVWTDGYYFTWNLFNQSDGSFPGPAVAAVDRNAMLAGAPGARMIVTKLTPADYSLLPADIDGTTLPPNGTPEQFAEYVAPELDGSPSDALKIYTLTTNWTAGTTTWGGPTTLNTSTFDTGLESGSEWVQQPDGAEYLDALNDRLMYRLAYRNLGSKQVMAVTHTVDGSNGALIAAPRWYLLQRTTGAWSIAQQSTYAPDATNRWMASIGIDHDGNLGMVYSFSSGSLYPSVGYTGRLASDAANAMQTGRTLVAGNQSQEALSGGFEIGRWGDYASTTLDPSDDCTFYMAEEYFATGGEALPISAGRNWHTRIGSFFFPSCMSYAPTAAAVGATVTIQGKRFEGATAVKFNGTSASTFSTDSVNHTLTVTVPAGATTGPIQVTSPAGTFTSATSFTVSGGGGGGSAAISSFSPTSAQTSTSVSILGSGFSGVSAVKFNGVPASSFTVVSPTQVNAVVPPTATYGPISIVQSSGTLVSGSSFAVVPTISSISPTAEKSGGTITITGTGFSGATAVKFNGVNATSFSVTSATSIAAKVPPTATTGPITVTLGGSGLSASSATFTPKPKVVSLSPTSGPVGTTVVLTGTNLAEVTSIKLGTKTVTSFTVNSATKITLTVPSGATTGQFTVSGPPGSAVSPTFTVT